MMKKKEATISIDERCQSVSTISLTKRLRIFLSRWVCPHCGKPSIEISHAKVWNGGRKNKLQNSLPVKVCDAVIVEFVS